MKPYRALAASVLSLMACSAALAQQQSAQPPVTLKIGDPAPALTVGKWIKGEPVEKLETGKLYVVEFWATWCGPCKASIPHLTEMAKKFTDVTFIGQDCLEEDESEVKPFVDQMGDKMSYRVATDSQPGQNGKMVTNWLTAAGQNGIPCAFIVGKDNKIAWIGHPMEMEPILEKVVAGTYDPKAAAAEKEKFDELNKQVMTAARAKDVDGVLAATKEIVKLKPDMAEQVTVFEYNILSRNGRTDDARARAKTIADTAKNPAGLNAVAWMIATQATQPSAEDLTIAHKAADRANEITKNKEPNLLDTSARLYAVEKNWDKATEVEKQAIAIADGDAKASLQKTLEAYQKQTLPAATE